MRNYNYHDKWQKLLTPGIVSLLTQIHEYKGEQTLFIEAKADTLTQLVEMAKIQSTEASNKIEGIYTSDERLKSLVTNKTTPRTRNEQEIAGYRDVLSTIHESHDFIPVKPSIILQLHRDLYKFSGKSTGGIYKGADNVIAEEDSEGNQFVRFQPVPAWETPAAIDAICLAFDEILSQTDADPLLIIPMFSIYSVLSCGFEQTKKAHGFLLPCAEWCNIRFYGGSNHYRMEKHPFYICIFAKNFTRQICPENSKKPRFSRGFLWLYLFYSLFMAEREGFEPSCGLSHKLISSQPRYDRFDISPSIFTHKVR